MKFRRSMSTSNALDPATWTHVDSSYDSATTSTVAGCADQGSADDYRTSSSFYSKYHDGTLSSVRSGSILSSYDCQNPTFSHKNSNSKRSGEHSRRHSVSRVRRLFQRNSKHQSVQLPPPPPPPPAATTATVSPSLFEDPAFAQSSATIDPAAYNVASASHHALPHLSNIPFPSPTPWCLSQTPPADQSKALRRHGRPSMLSFHARTGELNDLKSSTPSSAVAPAKPKNVSSKAQWRMSEDRHPTTLLSRLKNKVRRASTQVAHPDPMHGEPAGGGAGGSNISNSTSQLRLISRIVGSNNSTNTLAHERLIQEQGSPAADTISPFPKPEMSGSQPVDTSLGQTQTCRGHFDNKFSASSISATTAPPLAPRTFSNRHAYFSHMSPPADPRHPHSAGGSSSSVHGYSLLHVPTGRRGSSKSFSGELNDPYYNGAGASNFFDPSREYCHQTTASSSLLHQQPPPPPSGGTKRGSISYGRSLPLRLPLKSPSAAAAAAAASYKTQPVPPLPHSHSNSPYLPSSSSNKGSSTAVSCSSPKTTHAASPPESFAFSATPTKNTPSARRKNTDLSVRSLDRSIQKSRSVLALQTQATIKNGAHSSSSSPPPPSPSSSADKTDDGPDNSDQDHATLPMPRSLTIQTAADVSASINDDCIMQRQATGWRYKTKSMLGKVGLLHLADSSFSGSEKQQTSPVSASSPTKPTAGDIDEPLSQQRLRNPPDSSDVRSDSRSGIRSDVPGSPISFSSSLSSSFSSRPKPPPINVNISASLGGDGAQAQPSSTDAFAAIVSSPGANTPEIAAAHYDSQSRLIRRTLRAMWDFTQVKSPKSPIDALQISSPISSQARAASPSSSSQLASINFDAMWRAPHPFTPAYGDNSNKLFGMRLSQAVALTRHSDAVPLPTIVVRCIEYIDKHGLVETGIYRISGAASVVKRLKQMFDPDNGDKGIDFSLPEVDAHAVATLLKMYLRELPESLFTDELTSEFNYLEAAFPSPVVEDIVDCASGALLGNIIERTAVDGAPQTSPNPVDAKARRINDSTGVIELGSQGGPAPTASVAIEPDMTKEEWTKKLGALVERLPSHNYNVLSILLHHLHRVNKHSQANKMPLANLCLIFCTTLKARPHVFLELAHNPDRYFPAEIGYKESDSVDIVAANDSNQTLAGRPAGNPKVSILSDDSGVETRPSKVEKYKKHRSYNGYVVRTATENPKRSEDGLCKDLGGQSGYEKWLEEVRPEWLTQLNVHASVPKKRRSARRSQLIPHTAIAQPIVDSK
ncbi:hypothetical protein EV182_000598 [Spiromyces aspiralis]|uniref:Uncharacterized protein n=1 Tax=Spiromyces aspiralis TaxID=68401 RepID=A0ACC1HVS7_9FUNG|nr:hypothetical protein EV182_000598 [Spiromyces aspiralis]